MSAYIVLSLNSWMSVCVKVEIFFKLSDVISFACCVGDFYQVLDFSFSNVKFKPIINKLR